MAGTDPGSRHIGTAEELVELSRRCARWLESRGVPHDLAEDFAAEARIASMHQAPPARTYSFFFSVAWRRMIDWRRRRAIERGGMRRAAAGALLETRMPDAPQVARAEREDEARRVRDALATLPPETRHAIEARHFDGRPAGSIASERGVSRQAIQKQIQRGYQMLRARLGKAE